MIRPKLILPSLSMPWGRWVEEQLDDIDAGLARQVQDSGSAGNLFASRADLLQTQIGSIPSVAAIYQRDVPPFSQTRSSNPNATAYVYSAPAQTFNPPRRDIPYNYEVVAIMEASGLNMPFSRSIIRTNGIENFFQHENLQPGYQTQATYSIAGSGSVSPGEPVTAECGMVVSQAGTLTFRRVTLYCTFTGSIL